MIMEDLVIAVDLGGTQLRVAAYSGGRHMAVRHSEPTKAAEGLEPVLSRIVAGIQVVGDKAGWDRVKAIGVSAPGPLDPWQGVILWAPNLPGWKDVPLGERLSQAVDRPVFLGNDANLAALAEQRHGAGKGYTDLIYITVSTGIGGGVISDNRLIIGRRGLGAEVGHMTVEAHGPVCNCGNIGCLEAMASGTALARQAREIVAAGIRTRIADLVGGDVERVSAKIIHDAADDGDPVAVDLWRKAGVYLGVGIVNLMYLFGPGVIVIGGGLTKAGDLLFAPMRVTVRQRIKEVYWRDCPIVSPALGDDVSLIGAATWALEGIKGR
jgi:glucokinase